MLNPNQTHVFITNYSMETTFWIFVVNSRVQGCIQSSSSGYMPPPTFFKNAIFCGRDMIHGEWCDHWRMPSKPNNVDIWVTESLQNPVRLAMHTAVYDIQEYKPGHFDKTCFLLPKQCPNIVTVPQGKGYSPNIEQLFELFQAR